MSIHKKLFEFAKLSEPIGKDAVNPHFKNRYASLDKIQEIIKPWLEKSGIVVVHSVKDNMVVTTIAEQDGVEMISSCFPFSTTGRSQEIGSAMTYAKRYNLSALLNLTIDDSIDEDDDGEKDRNYQDKKIDWLSDDEYNSVISAIGAGKYDGMNGQQIVSKIRAKKAVNKAQESGIDKAASIRVGNK